jgi:hypothetical protein
MQAPLARRSARPHPGIGARPSALKRDGSGAPSGKLDAHAAATQHREGYAAFRYGNIFTLAASRL